MAIRFSVIDLSREDPATMKGVGENGDIPVEGILAWRLWDGQVARFAAFDVNNGEGEEFGGVFWFDGRAAKVPTAHDVERDLEAEPIGLFQSMRVKLYPFRRAELGAGRNTFIPVLACADR